MYSSRWVFVRNTVISNTFYRLAGFIYVDDTDLIILKSGREETIEIVNRAQKLLDTWQSALQLMGGELKLSKFFLTIQDYEWVKGKCMLRKETLF